MTNSYKEFHQKYNISKLKIFENNNWIVSLRPEQKTPFSLLLTIKSDKNKLRSLNKPEMIDSLRNVFIDTANKNNLLLIPAGEAFHRFNLNHPEIDLYTKDLRHPSKEGTYLAAAVVFATLYGKATAGNTGIMNLDPEVALKIQRSVDETVSDFMGVTLR